MRKTMEFRSQFKSKIHIKSQMSMDTMDYDEQMEM